MWGVFLKFTLISCSDVSVSNASVSLGYIFVDDLVGFGGYL